MIQKPRYPIKVGKRRYSKQIEAADRRRERDSLAQRLYEEYVKSEEYKKYLKQRELYIEEAKKKALEEAEKELERIKNSHTTQEELGKQLRDTLANKPDTTATKPDTTQKPDTPSVISQINDSIIKDASDYASTVAKRNRERELRSLFYHDDKYGKDYWNNSGVQNKENGWLQRDYVKEAEENARKRWNEDLKYRTRSIININAGLNYDLRIEELQQKRREKADELTRKYQYLNSVTHGGSGGNPIDQKELDKIDELIWDLKRQKSDYIDEAMFIMDEETNKRGYLNNVITKGDAFHNYLINFQNSEHKTDSIRLLVGGNASNQDYTNSRRNTFAAKDAMDAFSDRMNDLQEWIMTHSLPRTIEEFPKPLRQAAIEAFTVNNKLMLNDNDYREAYDKGLTYAQSLGMESIIDKMIQEDVKLKREQIPMSEEDIDQRIRMIEYQRDENLYNSGKRDLHEQLSPFNIGNMSPIAAQTYMNTKQSGDFARDLFNDQSEAAIRLLEKAKHYKEMNDAIVRNGVVDLYDVKNYGTTMLEFFKNPNTYTYDFFDASDAHHKYNISQKIQRGEDLSATEKQLAEAWAINDIFHGKYGDYEQSNSYKWTNIAAESLKFMTEFILTNGVASALLKGGSKLATSATKQLVAANVRRLEKYSADEARKVATRLIAGNGKLRALDKVIHGIHRIGADATYATFLSNTFGANRTAMMMYEKAAGRLNDYTMNMYGMVDVDDVNVKEARSLVESFRVAETQQFVENFSEMMGEFGIGKGLKLVGKAAAKKIPKLGEYLNKLDRAKNVQALRDTREAMEATLRHGYTRMNTSLMNKGLFKWVPKPNQIFNSRVLKAGQFHGFFGEISEEYYAILLNHMFGTPEKEGMSMLEDMADSSLDIWGGIALSTGMLGGISRGVSLFHEMQYESAERELYNRLGFEQAEHVRLNLIFADNEDVSNTAKRLAMMFYESPEKQKAILNYYRRLLSYRGAVYGEDVVKFANGELNERLTKDAKKQGYRLGDYRRVRLASMMVDIFGKEIADNIQVKDDSDGTYKDLTEDDLNHYKGDIAGVLGLIDDVLSGKDTVKFKDDVDKTKALTSLIGLSNAMNFKEGVDTKLSDLARERARIAANKIGRLVNTKTRRLTMIEYPEDAKDEKGNLMDRRPPIFLIKGDIETDENGKIIANDKNTTEDESVLVATFSGEMRYVPVRELDYCKVTEDEQTDIEELKRQITAKVYNNEWNAREAYLTELDMKDLYPGKRIIVGTTDTDSKGKVLTILDAQHGKGITYSVSEVKVDSKGKEEFVNTKIYNAEDIKKLQEVIDDYEGEKAEEVTLHFKKDANQLAMDMENAIAVRKVVYEKREALKAKKLEEEEKLKRRENWANNRKNPEEEREAHRIGMKAFLNSMSKEKRSAYLRKKKIEERLERTFESLDRLRNQILEHKREDRAKKIARLRKIIKVRDTVLTIFDHIRNPNLKKYVPAISGNLFGNPMVLLTKVVKGVYKLPKDLQIIDSDKDRFVLSLVDYLINHYDVNVLQNGIIDAWSNYENRNVECSTKDDKEVTIEFGEFKYGSKVLYYPKLPKERTIVPQAPLAIYEFDPTVKEDLKLHINWDEVPEEYRDHIYNHNVDASDLPQVDGYHYISEPVKSSIGNIFNVRRLAKDLQGTLTEEEIVKNSMAEAFRLAGEIADNDMSFDNKADAEQKALELSTTNPEDVYEVKEARFTLEECKDKIDPIRYSLIDPKYEFCVYDVVKKERTTTDDERREEYRLDLINTGRYFDTEEEARAKGKEEVALMKATPEHADKNLVVHVYDRLFNSGYGEVTVWDYGITEIKPIEDEGEGGTDTPPGPPTVTPPGPPTGPPATEGTEGKGTEKEDPLAKVLKEYLEFIEQQNAKKECAPSSAHYFVKEGKRTVLKRRTHSIMDIHMNTVSNILKNSRFDYILEQFKDILDSTEFDLIRTKFEDKINKIKTQLRGIYEKLLNDDDYNTRYDENIDIDSNIGYSDSDKANIGDSIEFFDEFLNRIDLGMQFNEYMEVLKADPSQLEEIKWGIAKCLSNDAVGASVYIGQLYDSILRYYLPTKQEILNDKDDIDIKALYHSDEIKVYLPGYSDLVPIRNSIEYKTKKDKKSHPIIDEDAFVALIHHLNDIKKLFAEKGAIIITDPFIIDAKLTYKEGEDVITADVCGEVDALIINADGSVDILDFKTYRLIENKTEPKFIEPGSEEGSDHPLFERLTTVDSNTDTGEQNTDEYSKGREYTQQQALYSIMFEANNKQIRSNNLLLIGVNYQNNTRQYNEDDEIEIRSIPHITIDNINKSHITTPLENNPEKRVPNIINVGVINEAQAIDEFLKNNLHPNNYFLIEDAQNTLNLTRDKYRIYSNEIITQFINEISLFEIKDYNEDALSEGLIKHIKEFNERIRNWLDNKDQITLEDASHLANIKKQRRGLLSDISEENYSWYLSVKAAENSRINKEVTKKDTYEDLVNYIYSEYYDLYVELFGTINEQNVNGRLNKDWLKLQYEDDDNPEFKENIDQIFEYWWILGTAINHVKNIQDIVRENASVGNFLLRSTDEISGWLTALGYTRETLRLKIEKKYKNVHVAKGSSSIHPALITRVVHTQTQNSSLPSENYVTGSYAIEDADKPEEERRMLRYVTGNPDFIEKAKFEISHEWKEGNDGETRDYIFLHITYDNVEYTKVNISFARRGASFKSDLTKESNALVTQIRSIPENKRVIIDNSVVLRSNGEIENNTSGVPEKINTEKLFGVPVELVRYSPIPDESHVGLTKPIRTTTSNTIVVTVPPMNDEVGAVGTILYEYGANRKSNPASGVVVAMVSPEYDEGGNKIPINLESDYISEDVARSIVMYLTDPTWSTDYLKPDTSIVRIRLSNGEMIDTGVTVADYISMFISYGMHNQKDKQTHVHITYNGESVTLKGRIKNYTGPRHFKINGNSNPSENDTQREQLIEALLKCKVQITESFMRANLKDPNNPYRMMFRQLLNMDDDKEANRLKLFDFGNGIVITPEDLKSGLTGIGFYIKTGMLKTKFDTFINPLLSLNEKKLFDVGLKDAKPEEELGEKPGKDEKNGPSNDGAKYIIEYDGNGQPIFTAEEEAKLDAGEDVEKGGILWTINKYSDRYMDQQTRKNSNPFTMDHFNDTYQRRLKNGETIEFNGYEYRYNKETGKVESKSLDSYDSPVLYTTDISNVSSMKLDEPAARKIIRDILGDVPAEVEDGILYQFGDSVVLGACYTYMIKLSRFAETGVAYHETFHYILELLTSEKDRLRYYKEYRKKFGEKLTDKEIAERAADEFWWYMEHKDNAEFKFTWNFLKLMKNLWSYYKFYNTISSKTLLDLYNSAQRGEFRNRKPSKEAIERFKTLAPKGYLGYSITVGENTVNMPEVLNSRQFDATIETVKYVMVEAIKESQNGNFDPFGMRLKSLKFDIDTLLKSRALIDICGSKNRAYTESAKDRFMQVLGVKYDRKKGIYTTEEHTKYIFDLAKSSLNTILGSNPTTVKLKKLLEEASKPSDADLPDDGADPLNIGGEKGLNIGAEGEGEEPGADGRSQKGFNKEEIAESSQFNSIDKASARVKFFFSRSADMEYYWYMTAEGPKLAGRRKLNCAGLPQYGNYKDVWNHVINVLCGCKGVYDLLNTLKKYSDANVHFKDLHNQFRSALMRAYEIDEDLYEATKQTTKEIKILRDERGNFKVKNEEYAALVTELVSYIHNAKVVPFVVQSYEYCDQTDSKYGSVVALSADYEYMAREIRKEWSSNLTSGETAFVGVDENGAAYKKTIEEVYFEEENGEVKQKLNEKFTLEDALYLFSQLLGFFSNEKKFRDKSNYSINVVYTEDTNEGGKTVRKQKREIIRKNEINLTNRMHVDAIVQDLCKYLNWFGVMVNTEDIMWCIDNKFHGNISLFMSGDFAGSLAKSFVVTKKNGNIGYGSLTFAIDKCTVQHDNISDLGGQYDNSGGTKVKFKYFVEVLANARHERISEEYQTMYLSIKNHKQYAITEENFITQRLDEVLDTNSDVYKVLSLDPYVMGYTSDNEMYGSLVLQRVKNEEQIAEQEHREVEKLLLRFENLVGFKTDTYNIEGVEYTNIDKRDDIISRYAVLYKGGLVMPTMSDKVTYGGIFGLPYMKLFGYNYNNLSNDHTVHYTIDDDGTIKFSDTILKAFVDYAKCEYRSAKLALERTPEEKDKVFNYDYSKQKFIEDYYDDKAENGKGAWKTREVHARQAARLSTFSGIFKEDGTYISFNRLFEVTSDGKKKFVDEAKNLLVAETEFFNLNYRTQLTIMNRLLNHRVLEELTMLTNLNMINIENGKYKNKYLSSSAINRIKESYPKDSKPDRTDYAILAYVADMVVKHNISIQECLRIYAGNLAFYIHTWDEETGELEDVSTDFFKRVGGFASTGQWNVTDIFGEEDQEVVCAEILDIKDNDSELFDIFELDLRPQVYRRYIRELSKIANFKPSDSKMNTDNIKDLRDTLINLITQVHGEDSVEDYLKVIDDAVNLQTDKLHGIDVSDGATYISDEFAERLLRSIGHFGDEVAEAFRILRTYENKKKEKLTDKDILTIAEHYNTVANEFIGMLKYTSFGQRPVKYTADDETEYYVNETYYDKTAFAPLFDIMCTGKMKIVKDVMKKNNCAVLKLTSATKEGNKGAVDLSEKTLQDLQNDSKALDNFKLNTYKQRLTDFRKQFNTDPNGKHMLTMGTQYLKVILSLIENDQIKGIVDEQGRQMSAEDLRDEIMNSLNKISKLGYDKIVNRFYKDVKLTEEIDELTGETYTKTIRGEFNTKEFLKVIEKLLTERDASGQMTKAVKLEHGMIKVPFSCLSNSHFIESIITSLINDEVVDVVSPGAAFIQRSVYGMEGKSTVITDNESFTTINHGARLKAKNELNSMDVVLSIDYFDYIFENNKELKYQSFEDKKQYLIQHGFISGFLRKAKHKVKVGDIYLVLKDGKLVIETIEEGDDRIGKEIEERKWHDAETNIVGYRIPTQAVSSIHAMRCVDVIPILNHTVILPREITAITGCDFDIDKFFMNTKFVRYKDNREVIEEYNAKINEKLAEYNGDMDALNEEYDKRYEARKNKFRLFDMDYIDDEDSVNAFIAEQEANIKRLGILWSTINFDKNTKQFEVNKLIQRQIELLQTSGNNLQQLYGAIDADTLPLKDIAKNILKHRGKTKLTAFSFSSIETHVEAKAAYMIGKKGIAPFALNNNSHILAMLYHLKFKEASNDLFTELKLLDLDKSISIDGTSILSIFSALINAHVDVAKDPWVLYLNINQYNYNFVSTLVRVGFGLNTFYLTTQKAMMDLSEIAAREEGVYLKSGDVVDGGGLASKYSRTKKAITLLIIGRVKALTGKSNIYSTETAFEALDNYFKNNENINKSTLDLAVSLLKTKEGLRVLKESALDHNKKEFTLSFKDKKDNLIEKITISSDELYCLILYINDYVLYKATAISRLVQYSKVDTKKYGKNITEQLAYMDGFEKLTDYENSLFDQKGLQDMIEKSYVYKKTKYATLLVRDLMKEFTLEATDGFISVYKQLNEELDNENLTEDMIKSRINAVSAFFKSLYFFGTHNSYCARRAIDPKDLVSGENNIFKQLQKLKIDIQNEANRWAGLKRSRVNIDTRRFKYLGLYDDNGNITNSLFSNLSPSLTFESPFPKGSLLNNEHVDGMQFVNYNKFTEDSVKSGQVLNDWEDLLNHENYELLRFAEQLIVYAFLTSGGYGSRNLFKYVPTAWMSGEVKVLENDKTFKTWNSYSSFMKRLINDMNKDKDHTLSEYDMDQIIVASSFDKNFMYNTYVTELTSVGMFNESKLFSLISKFANDKNPNADISLPMIYTGRDAERWIDKEIYPKYIKVSTPHVSSKGIQKVYTDSEFANRIYKFLAKGKFEDDKDNIHTYPIYVIQNPIGIQLNGGRIYGLGTDVTEIDVAETFKYNLYRFSMNPKTMLGKFIFPEDLKYVNGVLELLLAIANKSFDIGFKDIEENWFTLHGTEERKRLAQDLEDLKRVVGSIHNAPTPDYTAKERILNSTFNTKIQDIEETFLNLDHIGTVKAKEQEEQLRYKPTTKQEAVKKDNNGKVAFKESDINAVENSGIHVQFYKKHFVDSSDGNIKHNITVTVSLPRQRRKGFFEAVAVIDSSGNLTGEYHLHFKSYSSVAQDTKYANVQLTKADKATLFKALIDIIPDGAEITSNGELSKGGVRAMDNLDKYILGSNSTLTKIREKEVKFKKDSNIVKIPVYKKKEKTSTSTSTTPTPVSANEVEIRDSFFSDDLSFYVNGKYVGEIIFYDRYNKEIDIVDIVNKADKDLKNAVMSITDDKINESKIYGYSKERLKLIRNILLLRQDSEDTSNSCSI